MKTVIANDRMTLSKRTVTADGHLVAPAVIARVGIQSYRAYELGLTDRNPMTSVLLYRPPEEVFAPDSMHTFEGVPVTNDHPEGNEVTDANRDEVTVGAASGIERDGDLMNGVLTVTNADAVKAVDEGKVEVSNGYSFELDMTPGFTPDGKPYHGVQRNIRGNHVAIVDSARCGSACRIADSVSPLPKKENTMATRKLLIDSIPFELDEAAAAAVEKIVADRDALKTKAPVALPVTYKIGDKEHTIAADKVAETILTLHGTIAAKDSEIDVLRKDVMTPEARDAMVADWAKTLNEAKRLVPTIATDGKTCLAIKREVLASIVAGDSKAKAIANAVLGGVTADKAEEPAVRAAFNAVAASVEVVANDSGNAAQEQAVKDALLGRTVTAGDADDELSGPELLAHRMANAWQTTAA
jgi:hypothetical protein